jgi:hypothetical protein
MLSYHFDRDAPFNERNVGLGYMADNGMVGGAYRNSYNNLSLYAGKNFKRPINALLDAGVTLGGVTGYPASPVLPMVIPELTANLGDDTKLALLLQPPAGKMSKGALALQIRKLLK